MVVAGHCYLMVVVEPKRERSGGGTRPSVRTSRPQSLEDSWKFLSAELTAVPGGFGDFLFSVFSFELLPALASVHLPRLNNHSLLSVWPIPPPYDEDEIHFR